MTTTFNGVVRVAMSSPVRGDGTRAAKEANLASARLYREFLVNLFERLCDKVGFGRPQIFGSHVSMDGNLLDDNIESHRVVALDIEAKLIYTAHILFAFGDFMQDDRFVMGPMGYRANERVPHKCSSQGVNRAVDAAFVTGIPVVLLPHQYGSVVTSRDILVLMMNEWLGELQNAANNG